MHSNVTIVTNVAIMHGNVPKEKQKAKAQTKVPFNTKLQAKRTPPKDRAVPTLQVSKAVGEDGTHKWTEAT